jgi:hypothetical protein
MEKIVTGQLFTKEFFEEESYIEFNYIGVEKGKYDLPLASITVLATGEIHEYDLEHENSVYKGYANKFFDAYVEKVAGEKLSRKQVEALNSELLYNEFENDEKKKVNITYWTNALKALKEVDKILEEKSLDDEIKYSSDEEDNIIPNYGNKGPRNC